MNYTRFAQIASRLLTKFGMTATLVRRVSGTYVPATGAIPVTETSQSVKVVLTAYPEKMIDGTAIHTGDKQVSMSVENLDFLPQAGDRLVVGVVTYNVIQVKEHNPAGTVLLYELQVRR
jgi:hypothetical protein